MSKTKTRKLSENSQGFTNGAQRRRGAARGANGAVAPNSEQAAATSDAGASSSKPSNGKATARTGRGSAVLDVPVNFGDVSIGDGTARIGVRIDRALLNIDAADELLCGRRLNGRLLVLPPGDANGQAYIDPEVGGELRHELESTFDVKRFSASPKNITAGLTFSLQEVEVSELSHFAKRGGRLVVASIAAIPAKKRGRKAKAK